MSQSRFQTIVVGVDFSPYSKIVVKQALALALEQKAETVFVHTFSNLALTTGEVYIDIDKEFIKPLTKEVISFYKLKEIAPNSKIVVSLGKASDEIIALARRTQAPLIVVGHKGKSTSFGRFFIGSTAEQLALHSPYPVWIHRGNSVRHPQKILLPCDFTKRTSASLDLAKAFNGSSKSKFEFFHVVQPPVPILDAAQYKLMRQKLERHEAAHQQQFHDRFPEVPLVKKSGEPAPLIARESKKFDLIAMAPHSREGIFSGFGSVTTKVVRQGSTPILISH